MCTISLTILMFITMIQWFVNSSSDISHLSTNQELVIVIDSNSTATDIGIISVDDNTPLELPVPIVDLYASVSSIHDVNVILGICGYVPWVFNFKSIKSTKVSKGIVTLYMQHVVKENGGVEELHPEMMGATNLRSESYFVSTISPRL